jgi:formylglycine-generating enzyme required for sulfatase activity
MQVDAGEVMDVETGLVWPQASNLSSVSQSAAMAYCATFGLNGHTWRLPSVNELSSLVDDNPDIKRVSPAIDQCVFPDTPANAYYMSSSIAGTTPWALNYEDGFDSNSQTSGDVRCVR